MRRSNSYLRLLLLISSILCANALLAGLITHPRFANFNVDSNRGDKPPISLAPVLDRHRGSSSTAVETPGSPPVQPPGTPVEAALVGIVNVTMLLRTNSPRDSAALFSTPHTQHEISSFQSNPIQPSTRMAISNPPQIVTNFIGMSQTCTPCDQVPPDVQIAAGPNHLMEMVNDAGQAYDKQGTTVLGPFSLSDFFKTGSDSITDPKIMFDVLSGRWFSSILDKTTNTVRFAVSDSNDPTRTWHIYSVAGSCGLNGPSCKLDDPLIGVSNTEFVVSSNLAWTNSTFGAEYWVINKGNATEGALAASSVLFGPDNTLFTAYPVQSLSSTAVEYMVMAGEKPARTPTTTTTVKLFRINGVPPGAIGGTVPENDITILPLSEPIAAVQPGLTNTINTNDAQVLSAAWYQGSLWFGLNDGCTPPNDSARSCIRLVEIDTTLNCATRDCVIQDFDYYQSGQYYYYPALRIDIMGNLAVLYGYSSSSNYPSLAVTEHAISDPLNTLEQPQTLVVGSTIENFCCPGRYGDYFGAALDPSNPTMVWLSGEYNNASTGTCTVPGYQRNNCWSTYVGEMKTSDFLVSSSQQSLTIGATAGVSTITLSSLLGFSAPADLAPQAIVSISATNVDDPYGRSLGLSFDQALSPTFWNTQSYTVIGSTNPGQTTFSYSTNRSLTVGPHFLEFGVNSYPYHWHAQISVNGVLVADMDVDDNHFIHFAFQVGGASVSGGPAGAVPPTATISPTSLPLSAGQSASGTLTVSTSYSTTPGIYTVTVSAGSGAILRSTTITVTIVPDFTVSATTVNFIGFIFQGQAGTYTFAANAFNSFAGTVSLAASVSPSSGLTCTISPGSVSLGSSGTWTLSCSGLAGAYAVTMTGTSGSLSHGVTVGYTVESRDLFVQSLAGSGTATQGQMTLSASILNSGTHAELLEITYFYANQTLIGTVSSPALKPGGPSTTVSFTWNTTGVAQGRYVIKAHVEPSLYDINPGNNNLTIQATVFASTNTFSGVTATLKTVFTGSNPATNALYGTTTLVETNSATGANFVSNTIPMTVSSIDNVSSTFVAETPNAPYWLSVNCRVRTNAGSSCSLYRSLDVVYAQSGLVSATDSSYISARYYTDPSFVNWDPKADLNGDGVVNSLDSGILGGYLNAQIFMMAPNVLTLTSSPNNLAFPPGSTASATIAPTFSLSMSVAPTGINCSLLNSGVNNLICSSSTPGTYSIVISASILSGLGNSIVVHAYVNHIAVTPGPTSFTIQQLSSVFSTISISSIGGYTGNVNLSTTYTGGGFLWISISPLSGCCTLTNTNNIFWVSLNVTATCTASVSTYTVTVTGTDGSGNMIGFGKVAVGVTSGCGGSVAAGTLITLADGTQVPVQNLQVGMQLLSYDMSTHQYVTTTITGLTSVLVSNLMIIQTENGPALRVDQNPAQKLYVKLPDGTITLMSVTDLKVGYDLFQASTQTWVPITGISYVNHGQYIMYDIYNTAPGNYIANGYLDPTKLGPVH